MSVMISNCGTCQYRDDSVVLASNPPKYVCLNRNSGKRYVETGDYCKCWKLAHFENNFETATTDDSIIELPEGKLLNEYLFTTAKDLQKANLKLTERIQKLEDKVGKLEESVEVLDTREKPKQNDKWIVHRTLRKKGIEIYVKDAYKEYTKKYLEPWKEDKTIVIYTNKKNEALKTREENAIRVRDLLNKDQIGKRYLWVISKVEE